MAKKTSGARKTTSASERPAAEATRRKTVLTIKGTDAWRDWLESLSKFLRTPTSTIVDHALVRYAKEQGFNEPPPER